MTSRSSSWMGGVVSSCWVLVLLVVLSLSSPSTTTTTALTLNMAAKHTLYDLPVSNNGARCRLILYKKNIPAEEVTIVSPMDLGGLKSPEYLALNPQGKMPLLTVETSGLAVPESDTICRHLLSTYADRGPSFSPDDVRSNLVARLHDMYLTTIQGCLYKAVPPFGTFGCRTQALDEFAKQMGVIEDVVDDVDNGGPYLFGSEVSLADATLFPTMTFARFMLPKFGRDGPPSKVTKWYDGLLEKDADFAKVHEEVHTGLEGWDAKGRWDPIYLAGDRDDAPATVFDKILAGEIPADVVREDEYVLAFKDVAPRAPGHVLVIPKERAGLTRINRATKEHEEILGRLLTTAADVARELFGDDGARIVVNDGPHGGQEVYHLHVHVLGGRQLDSMG